MIRATWERFSKWWGEVGRPKTVAILIAWWQDLDEHPGLHFISMLVGMLMLCIVRMVVWLAA